MLDIQIGTIEYPWLKNVDVTRRRILLLSRQGLLTFAAIGQIAKAPIECKREPAYLTGKDGARLQNQDRDFVTAKGKHYECEAEFGSIGYDEHSGLQVSARRSAE
jgi:hypothetical protein